MPIDYGDSKDTDNNQVFVPKIGQSKRIKILSSKRVDDPDNADNFKSRSENFGYHYRLELEGGKYMLLNTFALFKEFQNNKVNDGDVININHIDRGEYEVEVIERNEAW